jgi:hypothetical protein
VDGYRLNAAEVAATTKPTPISVKINALRFMDRPLPRLQSAGCYTSTRRARTLQIINIMETASRRLEKCQNHLV